MWGYKGLMGWLNKPYWNGCSSISNSIPTWYDLSQSGAAWSGLGAIHMFNSSSDHWVVSLYNNDTFSGRMMTRSKKNNQGKLLVKVVCALASLYCASGLIPSLVYMWVEVVVGSHPCSKSFWLGPSIFLHPQKSTFQIPIQPVTVDKRSYLMECSLWNLISITSVSFNPLTPQIWLSILPSSFYTISDK